MARRAGERCWRSALTAVVLAVLAVLATNRSGCVPFLILTMARLACPRMNTIRMEFGFLIEGNGVCSVGRAKDVTTVPTMMFPNKEIERGATLRRVARR